MEKGSFNKIRFLSVFLPWIPKSFPSPPFLLC